ncbi:hypothetical protein ACF1G0_29850 [Streptomyces sp. NPDC013953]|uniref:hypothetical protein n=1 Tax=Streptomyces sp. NPDC013953 TaxID=3364868 RepID=UPI0036F54AF8
MDWESVADELYGLRPDRFTAARNERALAARTAGDQVLAARIRALRRPTLAAWTSNLLVRERPDETLSLVALGEGLRQAHHELDGERLRELSRRRHAVVTALAREARQLAADAGQPVGEDVQHEVEATLHAVLADPGAAEEWASGRLTKPLSAPVGFDAAATDAAAHRPARRPATPDEAAKTPSRSRSPVTGTGTARKAEKEDKEKQRRRAEKEAAEQQARRERIEQAREDAAMARREAEEREEEHERAEAERQRAQADLHDAEQRAAALAEELQRAEERRHTAAAEARGARDRAREADRSARRARRRAEEAAERLARAAADR